METQTKSWFEKIKHNHVLMMVLCCVVPLILVYAAVYYFGLSKSYLFWTVLILCPLMHFFMMKSIHNDEKGKGGCH